MVIFTNARVRVPEYETMTCNHFQNGAWDEIPITCASNYQAYNFTTSSDEIQGSCYIKGNMHVGGKLEVDGRIDCEQLKIRRDIDVDINVKIRRLDFMDGLLLDAEVRAEGIEERMRFGVPITGELLLQSQDVIRKSIEYQASEMGGQLGRVLGQKVMREGGIIGSVNSFNKTLVDIPIGKEVCTVSLEQIVSNKIIEGDIVGNIRIDFNKVRNAIKNKKKKIYLKKLESINIIKKENRAIELLKTIVTMDDVNNYKKNNYIDVQDECEDWKIYRVWKNSCIQVLDKREIRVKTSNVPSRRTKEKDDYKVIHELCTHLNNKNGPAADEVIAKILMAKFDTKGLYEKSNKYDKTTGIGIGWNGANNIVINQQEVLERV